MGNGDALLDGSAAHLFPCQNRFSVRLPVSNAAACHLQLHQLVDCLLLVGNLCTQRNAVGAE